MPEHNPAKYTPYHEMIARRAHTIWETRGCPDGCEMEHWLQAERELAAETSGQPAKTDEAKSAPPSTKRSGRQSR
jgi:hypothetical protein